MSESGIFRLHSGRFSVAPIMVTAAGSAPAGVFVFIKAALTVLVKAVSPVVIVFMEAVLTVFFQVLAFLFVMVTEGRGIFSVSAVFFGVCDFSGTGDRSPFFFLQGLMNDRASGIFRID